jgi:hypothetical protein
MARVKLGSKRVVMRPRHCAASFCLLRVGFLDIPIMMFSANLRVLLRQMAASRPLSACLRNSLRHFGNRTARCFRFVSVRGRSLRAPTRMDSPRGRWDASQIASASAGSFFAAASIVRPRTSRSQTIVRGRLYFDPARTARSPPEQGR